jgi:hypothetical protein
MEVRAKYTGTCFYAFLQEEEGKEHAFTVRGPKILVSEGLAQDQLRGMLLKKLGRVGRTTHNIVDLETLVIYFDTVEVVDLPST